MIVALVVALVAMFSFPALALADECPAAPDVAGQILEDAGIDNRYGTGKDGGNYIREVAKHMGPDTDFNGVSKCDVLQYEYEITMFLIGLPDGADLDVPQNSLISVVFDGAGSGAGDEFGDFVGDTMTFTFLGDIVLEDPYLHVYFSDGSSFWSFYGKTTYIISGNILTVTCTALWNTSRPSVGASVTGFAGIEDSVGNAVVVPASGVPIIKI